MSDITLTIKTFMEPNNSCFTKGISVYYELLVGLHARSVEGDGGQGQETEEE